MSDIDMQALRHHGDQDARPGALDFAVNVRGHAPNPQLLARLHSRMADLHRYPLASDEQRATAAVAAHHGVTHDTVLLLAGAAEAFHLIASYAARHHLSAAVVHPSFTEPEHELRRAHVPVERIVLPPPFRLDPSHIPDDADLVIVGNPTNPTSVLHPAGDLAALCQPGRITVIDEAFCDIIADEHHHSLASAKLPGLLVVRSLTKTWGLAGLRAGYALGAPAVIAELSADRAHWPLGTLQLEAITWCAGAQASEQLAHIVETASAESEAMVAALTAAGIEIAAPVAAPFMLVRTPQSADPERFRQLLTEYGVATRCCDTFPGLDASYLRLAVRDGSMVEQLVRAWQRAVDELRRE